jgi:hypothetical protein
MMRMPIDLKIVGMLLLMFCSDIGISAEVRPAKPAVVMTKVAVPDSKLLERDLQRLSWKQFRWVVESVPKLKAGVDAYGPMGWRYVQSRYATYPWKSSIDRLDTAEKLHLVELIRRARKVR